MFAYSLHHHEVCTDGLTFESKQNQCCRNLYTLLGNIVQPIVVGSGGTSIVEVGSGKNLNQRSRTCIIKIIGDDYIVGTHTSSMWRQHGIIGRVRVGGGRVSIGTCVKTSSMFLC